MKSFISKFSVFAILLVAGLSIGFFSSYEEEGHWPLPTEEPDVWECKLSDGTKITLNFYEPANMYFSQVSDSANSNILFENNIWETYQMIGDTMQIIKYGDMEITPDGSSRKWIINKPSEDVMRMTYYGVTNMYDGLITEYEFHLK